MSVAVVTIDLQYLFGQPARPTRLSKALCLPGIRRLLHLSSEKRWQVVHMVTEHPDGTTLPAHLVRRGVVPYCIAGSDGAQLVDGLFRDGDLRVQKRSYSGFVQTDLEQHLADSEAVLICGVAADCCVSLTAFDAATRLGKQVFLPYEAVSSADRLGYVAGLRSIAKSAGSVLSLDTVGSLEAGEWYRRSLPSESVEDVVGRWFDNQQARARDALDSYRRDSGRDIRAAVAHIERVLG